MRVGLFLKTFRQKSEIPSFEHLIESMYVCVMKALGLEGVDSKLVRVGYIMLVDCLLGFLFCLPLYVLVFFDVCFESDTPLWLGSVAGIISVYVYMRMPKNRRFGVGVFVGLFCFYWVGLSFRFVGLEYLVPVISLLVALVYGVVFWLVAFCECLLVRLLGLLLLGSITPFGFDWLNVSSFFAYSYFGLELLHLALIVCAVYLFITRTTLRLLGALLLLFLALDFRYLERGESKQDFSHITLASTQVTQELKWNPQKNKEIVSQNLKLIRDSKNTDKRVVVLPENAFPFVLSKDSDIYNELLELSAEIVIITGALYREQDRYYNSLFVFDDSKVSRVDKVVLAPFGEVVPLPYFIKKHFPFLLDMEFARGSGFEDIKVLGQKIRVGICYEATHSKLYEDYPNVVLAISNNAWFYPSIEPVMQRMLMKYYARKNNSFVLHAANMSKSFVLAPF